MTFIKFTETFKRHGGVVKATIWPRGLINISKSAATKYMLNKWDYVVLYFDDHANKIGLKFTNDPKEEGVYKLVKRKEGGLSFSGTAFLRLHKIDFKISHAHPFSFDPQEDLHIIDLGKAIT